MEWSGILQSALILWDLSIQEGGGGRGGVFFLICINFYFQHVTYFPVPVWLMSVSLVDHYEYELLLCPTAIFLFPSSMLPMYPRNTFASDVCAHTLYTWVCAWACVYKSFVCLCNSNCKHVSMSHVPVHVCTHYVWLIHIDTNYGFFLMDGSHSMLLSSSISSLCLLHILSCM